MKLLHFFLGCLIGTQIFATTADTNKVLPPTALTIILNVTNATCNRNNGKIIVYASGGVAPYQYECVGRYNWTNPYFFYLDTGTYIIKVTDAIGQVVTQNATIINFYNRPKVSLISKTKPTGCTTFDGTITLQGSVGPPPYTYTLDGYTFQQSNTFNTLTAGSYNYAVKDANGCTSDSFYTLILERVEIGSNCGLLYNGAAGGGGGCNLLYLQWAVAEPIGTPPYTYSKDGINYQNGNMVHGNNFDSIPVGVFTWWIKDSTGLVLAVSVSRIDEHYNCPPFTVNTNVQTAICGQNGSLTITATDGIPPYQYSLDGVSFQTNNQFNGLASGNYTVTVKDSLNLLSLIVVNIPNHCVTVTANTTSSSCGNSNGKIIAQASSGTPPYTYSLDGINYVANNIFTNLAAGNYVVHTKDTLGLAADINVIVNNIAGSQITAIDTIATGCDNHSGKLNVITSGGTPPLQYSIDGIVFQNASIFTNLTKGLYTLTAKDANGCITTKDAIITMSSTPPVVNLGSDATFCEGQTLLLDATNSSSTYRWQDNSTNPTYLVTTTGQYFVTVKKSGCTAADTINVNYNLKPHFSLGADRRICLGSTIILDPKITDANYLWQDGSINPTYTVTQPGLYSLIATNNCGSTSDTVLIGNGICDLYVPNAFTPNGDGKNDYFKAEYGDNVTEFHLQIFNHYGQVIFETTDKNKNWDGNYRGAKQSLGTYIWFIQYKTSTTNSLQKLQGTVLLLR